MLSFCFCQRDPFTTFPFGFSCFFGPIVVLARCSSHYFAVFGYFKPFCQRFFCFVHFFDYCLETIIVNPLGSRFSSLSVLIGINAFNCSKNNFTLFVANCPIAFSLPLNDIFILTLSPSFKNFSACFALISIS